MWGGAACVYVCMNVWMYGGVWVCGCACVCVWGGAGAAYLPIHVWLYESVYAAEYMFGVSLIDILRC